MPATDHLHPTGAEAIPPHHSARAAQVNKPHILIAKKPTAKVKDIPPKPYSKVSHLNNHNKYLSNDFSAFLVCLQSLYKHVLQGTWSAV